MRDLRLIPDGELQTVRIVLTDIDDTLTVDGYLPAAAYEAMERLRQAGLLVVPVTGRPAGWCDLIARIWPVDGVIGENGAFYFRYRAEQRRMVRAYAQPDSERDGYRQKLQQVRDRVLAEVPDCRISADQAYRETDLAVDFAEDVGPLPPEAVERILSLFAEAGAIAKVSSIHVNGWFGNYDKLVMARRMLADEFGVDIDTAAGNEAVAFVGDSPNDEPMFAFFKHSVAVANFAAFADRVSAKPRWLTAGAGGFGFQQVAAAILAARP